MKKFLKLVITSIVILLLSGCMDEKVQNAVDQVKEQLETTLTGITGNAITAAVDHEANCVIIDIYTKPDRQQIVISKENLAENELCVAMTEEDLLPPESALQ